MHATRQTDTSLVNRIETLIETEPDPIKRTQLLVQLQIANLLIDNITSVRLIADEFKTHRNDYEKHVDDQNTLVNRSWGVWKVVGVVYFTVQSVIGWMFADTVNDYKEVKAQVQRHSIIIESLTKKAP